MRFTRILLGPYGRAAAAVCKARAQYSVLGPVATMLEIGPKSRTKGELTNRIDQMDRIIQMRLSHSLSIRDLGPISSIVDTGP